MLAQEYIRIVYEMSEVLSVSRLEPRRVLDTAITIAIDSMDRLGVPEPLFCAALLYSEEADIEAPVLRIARASMSVPPLDYDVVIPGLDGVVATVLGRSEPGISTAPIGDPELKLFDSYARCGTVAVIPLRSGDELYGVLAMGTQARNAFTVTHTDLLHAISNQAAASLNNVRLYGTLIEERDRVVRVERDARAQLASELHDGPTQGVAAVTMRLNYVRKLLERRPENAMDELYAIEDMARRTTKEIRHMPLRTATQGTGFGSWPPVWINSPSKCRRPTNRMFRSTSTGLRRICSIRKPPKRYSQLPLKRLRMLANTPRPVSSPLIYGGRMR